MKPKLETGHLDAPEHAALPCCPNCQVRVHGRFCSACGESLVVHVPTAREFIHEFIGHFVALEGKLWHTLRLLVLKPGALTSSFLQGRRVPFIDPLRLYLTMSLIVFALIKVFGIDLPQVFIEEKAYGVRYAHRLSDSANPNKPRTVAIQVVAREKAPGDIDSIRDVISLPDLIAALERIDTRWANNVTGFMRMPPDERAEVLNHGFLANLPYMLIGALPLFALYLKLMYLGSGRRYGEHLVFALHFSSFAFLLASAMIILPGSFAWVLATLFSGAPASATAMDWLQVLPVMWAFIYLPVALHRVYGGRRWANGARALVLLTVHFVVIAGLVVVAELIPILRHG